MDLKGEEGGGEWRLSLLFVMTSFFFGNHFEERQTVLFEVQLIINNAPLTHV